MYLLPKEHLATKRIIEGGPATCDIYTEHACDTTKQQTEDFMRFVETHLNKMKKIHCQRSTRVSVSHCHNRPSHQSGNFDTKFYRFFFFSIWITKTAFYPQIFLCAHFSWLYLQFAHDFRFIYSLNISYLKELHELLFWNLL